MSLFDFVDPLKHQILNPQPINDVGFYLSPVFSKVPILASSSSSICHPDRNDGKNPVGGIGVSFVNFDVGCRFDSMEFWFLAETQRVAT